MMIPYTVHNETNLAFRPVEGDLPVDVTVRKGHFGLTFFKILTQILMLLLGFNTNVYLVFF